jgi:hypothetical protein
MLGMIRSLVRMNTMSLSRRVAGAAKPSGVGMKSSAGKAVNVRSNCGPLTTACR